MRFTPSQKEYIDNHFFTTEPNNSLTSRIVTVSLNGRLYGIDAYRADCFWGYFIEAREFRSIQVKSKDKFLFCSMANIKNQLYVIYNYRDRSGIDYQYRDKGLVYN